MMRRIVCSGLVTGLLGAFAPLSSDAIAAAPAETSRALEPATCSLEDGVAQLREALRHGSPAFQRYARAWLKESAHALPLRELEAMFASERDPEVVEALSAALAARSARTGEHAALASVLVRATSDRDPAARAAALRGLRRTGSVEAMERVGPLKYTDLIQDPAPEVQAAVADNLIAESAEVYFGHDRAVAEQAVAVALGASEPQIAGKLLRETSMEAITPATARTLISGLADADRSMQAALAAAIGGVPAHAAGDAEEALFELYKDVADVEVREAVLAALVHLKLGAARETLESLRPVDPSLSAEIDVWIAVLGLGLQEWSLIRREKERLSP